MKNYTKTEIKTANKIAYQHIYGINGLLFNRKFSFDKRTRIGHLANSIVVSKKINDADKREIILLKKQRSLNKKTTSVSILELPLVKDYINNKGMIKFINDDRINFYGRNHYAKNAKDYSILAILRKKFYAKNVN